MNIDANIFFSALANEIRLRCLVLLQLNGELCVCELTHAMSLSQPMISRHLALLRDAGLVIDRRMGQWIFYSIQPTLCDWAKNVLETTARANKARTPFSTDVRALKSMPRRPGTQYCA